MKSMKSPLYNVEQVRVGSREFDAILALRAIAYGRAEAGERDPIDEYSFHFAAIPARSRRSSGLLSDLPLGSLRVTCRTHGALESEACYPRWLLDEFGDRLGSASRMCVRPDLKAVSAIPRDLAVNGWEAALLHGVRLDVSKARLKAIPFYLRMGYLFVRNSVFEFERWKTHCGLIALPANSEHVSVAPVFASVADPVDLTSSRYASKFTSSYAAFCEDTNARSRSDAA